MKIYKDLIQGTDEWKEMRHGKIGGSSLKEVMANEGKPVENNSFFYELIGQRTEEFDCEDGIFVTKAMQRGVDLEPVARAEFERIYGKKVHEIGWLELSDFVGISPDGLIATDDELETWKIKEALEIKCPTRAVYMKYLIDNQEAIDDYPWQIVHYFLTTGIEKLNLFIYRPENKLAAHILIEITKDTIINVSKKKSATVETLVEEARTRLNELEVSLKNRIELLTPKTNF